MLAQRRQNREAMEKLQLQHARGSQQLLGIIQNQMGLSMPGNSGAVTPGPAPLTPGARSTLPSAVSTKRRSRCNKCDACTALLAANVRRQWCETWKPGSDTVPRGPDGRYLKRETDDEGAEEQKKKSPRRRRRSGRRSPGDTSPLRGRTTILTRMVLVAVLVVKSCLVLRRCLWCRYRPRSERHIIRGSLAPRAAARRDPRV